MNNMIDYVEKTTVRYLESMPKSERKKLGQFFTSKESAIYMSSLFCIPHNKEIISILDAGAGTGILVTALVERLQKYESIKEIQITCYENDPKIIDLLNTNLIWISSNSKIKVKYTLLEENYILLQQINFNEMLGCDYNPEKFDLIIGNPPYMKISKDTAEARAMPSICYGVPNMYFLFAAMGIYNLKNNGELVYIIPRSWTSGAYFKKFREYLFSNTVIHNIHLFVSRDQVFENENVLQETIIIKIVKNSNAPKNIKITTSKSGFDFNNITYLDVPYNTIVSGENQYVYLVTNEDEINVLKSMNKWSNTLPELGLKMKTGLTVDFRNKDVLRSNNSESDAVPLFYSQHIKNGKVNFPIGKDNEFITKEKKGLLQKNRNYLFVKRFTTKEETRRLQCGIYLAKKYSDYDVISTQNKINFIGDLSEVSECIIYGLYVLLNSTIYDKYYRILNGSTQVNATEINLIPIPPLNIIEEMGKRLITKEDISEMTCNSILKGYI